MIWAVYVVGSLNANAPNVRSRLGVGVRERYRHGVEPGAGDL